MPFLGLRLDHPGYRSEGDPGRYSTRACDVRREFFQVFQNIEPSDYD